MLIRIKTCRGGFHIEVQADREDPNPYSRMPGENDFEEVLFNYADLERKIRELLVGKNCPPDAVDHGKKDDDLNVDGQ